MRRPKAIRKKISEAMSAGAKARFRIFSKMLSWGRGSDFIFRKSTDSTWSCRHNQSALPADYSRLFVQFAVGFRAKSSATSVFQSADTAEVALISGFDQHGRTLYARGLLCQSQP